MNSPQTAALRGPIALSGFDTDSKETLLNERAMISRAISVGVDRFYQRIIDVPELRDFFDDDATKESAKSRQNAHWETMLSGEIEDALSSGSSRVGRAHVNIGLNPHWYAAGYAFVLSEVISEIVPQLIAKLPKKSKDFAPVSKALSSVMRCAVLDLGASIAAYADFKEQERQIAEDKIRASEQEQDVVIAQVAGFLERLAEGDLREMPMQDLPGAFATMGVNMQDAARALRQMMHSVNGSTDRVIALTDTLRNAFGNFAGRTEEQAASLEETAASMERLSSSVAESAADARSAEEAAASAHSESAASGKIVIEAVAAMDALSKSSDEIVSIVRIIDDIAFQTNLLALNASVEAARAGDAGRGFAVVAQEVRALSQRCAEAAKEIKDRVDHSAGQVKSAVGLVEDVGTALTKIKDKVSGADGLISSIAAKSVQQSDDLTEISVAVTQLDQINQENVLMVEKITQETNQLMSDVGALRSILGAFNLEFSEGDHGVRDRMAS